MTDYAGEIRKQTAAIQCLRDDLASMSQRVAGSVKDRAKEGTKRHVKQADPTPKSMRAARVISRAEFMDAWIPMMDALGIDPMAVYDEGMTITLDGIKGLTCAMPIGGDPDGWVPVGDDALTQEKAWPFLIKIDHSIGWGGASATRGRPRPPAQLARRARGDV